MASPSCLQKTERSQAVSTIGLGVHRPEMIPYMADAMRHHDVICLEEPPTEEFNQMLEGLMPVDDYIAMTDTEYPAFGRELCRLLCQLHAGGKKILQVEPYLEILFGIHAFFADGHGPEDLARDSIHYPVYLAERNATGALLRFYGTSTAGAFDETLDAVMQFARLDAARFRLRDSLRAQALAAIFEKHAPVYVEAGLMHYPLWRLLRRELGPGYPVRVMFLAEHASRANEAKGHFYSPGDRLTLLYVFHSNFDHPERERLLAARALVYSKLIVKTEILDGAGGMPHLLDEMECIHLSNRLVLDDCRRLFPMIRRVGNERARQIVAEYLDG